MVGYRIAGAVSISFYGVGLLRLYTGAGIVVVEGVLCITLRRGDTLLRALGT